MNFNNYNESEPHTYTLLKEKLEISSNEFEKKLYEKNIDAHTQIKQANMYAKRLEIFIKIFLKKRYIDFLDCGCGLGYIARELKKLSNHNIHYCDPSDSVKKIHDKIFPEENFFQSDIENLTFLKKRFDLIYLREVYPFTRDNNFENQEKLIKILNNKLNKNGFLIFEQIKNKKDLFNNLSKLSIKYKIFFLLPARFGTNEILNNFCFKSSIFQFFLRILYMFLGKKINHFILIHKS